MVVAKVARQKLPKRSYQQWHAASTDRATASRAAPAVDSLPTARVQAGSEWKDIKLDTGAQFCVAGESWKRLGRRLSSLPPVDYVEGFTGAVAKVEGVWRFEFTTQYGQMMPVDALVVEGAADEFLLGEDWMLQNGVKIDFTSCEMKWYDGGDKKVVPFSCTTTDEEAERTVQVRLVRKQRVQTQTCRQVELAVAAPEGTVGLFMPASGAEPHLMLAPTLTTVHDGKVVVPIMNLVGRTSKLPSREKLGTWTPTSEDMTIMEVTGEFDQARVKQWLETQLHDENAPLSNEGDLKLGTMEQEDKELLLRLLRHYPKLLEPRDGCPPQTTLGVSHEIHTGNEPPIKVRPRRHSHSEQAIIDEQTDKMLMDGVIEEANGAWGFPVLLSCLVYLDDVIIFSRSSVAQHVVQLAAVLERLAGAGLSLKASKCSFASEKLNYLGHELDGAGVRPMSSLVESVKNFPTPTDVTEVKRFVHMAGYYRRFVSDFAAKAAPMTKLLRKGVVWRWGDSQKEAFECLKKALTEQPLLAYPDISRPFRLVTDASQVGLGAALTQDQGHGEQPIAYASKINSPTVAKYSITELECAAVVWAVKLFRPYLYGRKFVLMTDHAALKWLMTSKELAGRLHRWALQLQEYDFEVVYRPGSSNVVADALSRAPARVVTAASQETETRTDGGRAGEGSDGQLTDQAIKAEQAQDRTVQNLVRKGKYGGRKIVVEDEVVHIVENDGSKRVVLPTALWAAALRENHDSIYACHLRTPQTYARVARS
ncbi:hypothetical protein PR001_g27690 [Phytophthora rubi]|uniref:RNA-directed DNA polymerase n=1 Tax=Phytophthora rubi TaxID=129364 RepID=A0A6A3HHP0_9STRA|nr:hypothetical protein PR001_g27690 [Phytophthora rubi]